MKLNLKNKFLLTIIALITACLSVSTTIFYFNFKGALFQTVTGQIEQTTANTVDMMARWFKDRRLDLNTWSKQKIFTTALQDSFLGESARKGAGKLLAEIKNGYGYYENICIANLKGELIAAADGSVLGKINVQQQDYFQIALTGQPAVSAAQHSEASGDPIFVFSVPLKVKGKVAGALISYVDLTVFSRLFIDTIEVGSTGYAYMFDDQGFVIAHPDKSNLFKLNLNSFDFGREMIAMVEGLLIYTFKGMEKLVVFQKFEEMGWTVGIGAGTHELLAPVRRLGLIILAIGVGFFVIASAITIFIVRSIVRPVNQIVADLNQGADQVDAASSEVSSASQVLAGGASQQASSIEETSAALEEIASRVRQNADNAQQANTIMKQTNGAVDHANQSMLRLTTSMDKINRASEKTSRIVNTIEGIAFQTNLLALNAAVEAARAGEAGAGFAIVADEVRNLAMRTSQAVKDTTGLIAETVQRVSDGAKLVQGTNDAFSSVTASASKVSALIDEISSASDEQSKGINQVNVAINAMDDIVQQTAASAEESASASEELNAQAVQMKHSVDDLVVIVKGADRNGKRKRSDAGRREDTLIEAPDVWSHRNAVWESTVEKE